MFKMGVIIYFTGNNRAYVKAKLYYVNLRCIQKIRQYFYKIGMNL